MNVFEKENRCVQLQRTTQMNVFEKESQNEHEQRNVPLRLKTESVLTQCTNAESIICIVKIVFNSLRK